jgi:hypothetical protein
VAPSSDRIWQQCVYLLLFLFLLREKNTVGKRKEMKRNNNTKEQRRGISYSCGGHDR